MSPKGWDRHSRGVAAVPAAGEISAPFLQASMRLALLPFLAVTTLAAQGTPLTLLGYQAAAPASWQPVKPSSSSRLAQFTIPGSGAGDPAEVVVYFFGSSQGGNVEANLARWRDQFTNPGAPPVTERVARDSTGPFPLTIAEYEGSYRRGIGAGSADSVRAGQSLVAAIVETPRGTMFVQLFGATGRVAAARAAFGTFVKGIH